MSYVILCCAILYYNIPYYTILYYTILYYYTKYLSGGPRVDRARRRWLA